MSVVVMVAIVVEEDKRKRTFFLGKPDRSMFLADLHVAYGVILGTSY